jgi:hypothetical protein
MIFYTHERNFGCRVTEYIYKGLRTVTLENELLRVSILADKGTDIFEFLYKPLDVDFLWRSPWGVRNPASFVPTTHTAVSSFLDFYEGGWQDCLPSGGNPCEYLGFPFGAHGETPTLPWEYCIQENTPERVSIRFWVRTYRTPFLIQKIVSMERSSPLLSIEESIMNEGRTTMHLMWGQHPAFGPPFVDESCRIDLPGSEVHCSNLSPTTRFVEGVHPWPHVPAKEGGTIDLRQVESAEVNSTDTIRISGLSEGWYAVTNPRRKIGFGMTWPLDVFPAVWFWQVYGGAYGPPWYGRTYNIALEPFSTVQLTLPDAIQDGSAHVLAPGESIQANFAAIAYEGMNGVARISPEGEVFFPV